MPVISLMVVALWVEVSYLPWIGSFGARPGRRTHQLAPFWSSPGFESFCAEPPLTSADSDDDHTSLGSWGIKSLAQSDAPSVGDKPQHIRMGLIWVSTCPGWRASLTARTHVAQQQMSVLFCCCFNSILAFPGSNMLQWFIALGPSTVLVGMDISQQLLNGVRYKARGIPFRYGSLNGPKMTQWRFHQPEREADQ